MRTVFSAENGNWERDQNGNGGNGNGSERERGQENGDLRTGSPERDLRTVF